MKGFSQYCPIARGAEIFAERWTPIIVRNLFVGCQTFTEIERGAPGISRTLLAQRLRQLERVGVVERIPARNGRGPRYLLTESGEELGQVCVRLGEWGARWLELAPEHLDPSMALWSWCQGYVNAHVLPKQRVVVRFEFLQRPKRTLWILFENGSGEVCQKNPGFEEDLVVTADPEWFIKWHMGRVSWQQAVREGRITVEGRRDLARALPTWNLRSRFQAIKPRFSSHLPRRSMAEA
ncbi:MAG: winged helix-turn-helix transcriptional regulator [Actinomycetota bacterium]